MTTEYHGKLLNLCISGSHLYGFESEDSDIDYRGCFVLDTNSLLGMSTPRDYVERTFGENDVVLNELKKELGLLDKGNCNILEHLYAKQLYTSDEYFELKKIISLNLNVAGVYHSYRGMAWWNYNKFCLSGKHTVKKFLYVFRGQLAGIHAIKTRTIEPNITKLIADYPEIQKLVQLKINGNEKQLLEDEIGSKYHGLVEKLFSVMDNIYEEHQVSEKLKAELDHSRAYELDKFLKKIRKKYYQ